LRKNISFHLARTQTTHTTSHLRQAAPKAAPAGAGAAAAKVLRDTKARLGGTVNASVA